MKQKFGFQFALFGASLLLASVSAFGLGSDYSTNNVVAVAGSPWPKGFVELVNTTNRVHGFFVNETDVFFFRGGTNEFNAFLQAYSKMQGIEGHEVILHEGIGDAKSPWGKEPRECDWSLTGCPKGWRKIGQLSASGTNSVEELLAASKITGYILTIDFWTGGKISFDQLKIPENVKVIRDAKTK